MSVSGVHEPIRGRKDAPILSAVTSQNASEAADILPRFLKGPALSKPTTGLESQFSTLPITFHMNWASTSACMNSDTEEHNTGSGGPLQVLNVSL